MKKIGQSVPRHDGAISIVLPALNEEQAIPRFLGSLAAQQGVSRFELILVDGGSRDRTVEAFSDSTRGWSAKGIDARVIACSPPGRARQLNLGARHAGGETLLFLHADSELPADGLCAVQRLLRDDPRVVGGGFRLKYSDAGLLLNLIATYATLRSLLWRIHYGDQGIFVRRQVFEALGGFPDLPLFEDLRFSRALRRSGRIRTAPLALATSARRLREAGTIRTGFRFAWLKLRHACGVDPARLKSDYPDVR